MQAFTAPYPSGTLATNLTRGSTVYVRSVVSDPFGSFDIAGANKGTENTVTDLGLGAFQIIMPSLQVQKLSEVLSDPVNGNSNGTMAGASGADMPSFTVRFTVRVE